jgi:hypothetical protein
MSDGFGVLYATVVALVTVAVSLAVGIAVGVLRVAGHYPSLSMLVGGVVALNVLLG